VRKKRLGDDSKCVGKCSHIVVGNLQNMPCYGFDRLRSAKKLSLTDIGRWA
jgi:hypothetical protein